MMSSDTDQSSTLSSQDYSTPKLTLTEQQKHFSVLRFNRIIFSDESSSGENSGLPKNSVTMTSPRRNLQSSSDTDIELERETKVRRKNPVRMASLKKFQFSYDKYRPSLLKTALKEVHHFEKEGNKGQVPPVVTHKEMPPRPTARARNTLLGKKGIVSKPTKNCFMTRRHCNVGAIYSPVDYRKELRIARDWPVSGMHSCPVYNEQENKLEYTMPSTLHAVLGYCVRSIKLEEEGISLDESGTTEDATDIDDLGCSVIGKTGHFDCQMSRISGEDCGNENVTRVSGNQKFVNNDAIAAKQAVEKANKTKNNHSMATRRRLKWAKQRGILSDLLMDTAMLYSLTCKVPVVELVDFMKCIPKDQNFWDSNRDITT